MDVLFNLGYEIQDSEDVPGLLIRFTKKIKEREDLSGRNLTLK